MPPVLFMIGFSFGFTPLQCAPTLTSVPWLTHRGLYPAEVLSFENRAKGLSLQGWVTNALTTINTFGLPPALGKLGYTGKSIASDRATSR